MTRNTYNYLLLKQYKLQNKNITIQSKNVSMYQPNIPKKGLASRPSSNNNKTTYENQNKNKQQQ